jgi:two-component system, OmpR family, response regulator ChvI
LHKHNKILIVDDDVDTIDTFRVGLEKHGFEVNAYNNPLTALSKFKPNFYDVLMIDIRMPKMNGFELAEKILKIDITSKICFITAFDVYYEGLVEEYPNLDITCFIKKPITIEALSKQLKTRLNE